MKRCTFSGSGVSDFSGKKHVLKLACFPLYLKETLGRVSWFRVDVSLKTVFCTCAHASVDLNPFGFAIIF